MKILLLNQTFYPDVMATSNFLSDLAVALVERGHQVTVVAGRRAYDSPDKLFAPRETWRGVRIFRVFSTRFGKTAKWRRAADFASFIFFSCLRLLFLPRQDVVVALTTPPLISFIGAWRAKLWGARFCYWVMDMNPDEAIAAGWLRAGSPSARLLERMSRFSFRQSAWVIALDRFMRDRIIAKGVSPEKVAVISPWSHDAEIFFVESDRQRFRKKHGFEGKFLVMYAGNHSPVHPLDTLMRAAEVLQSDDSVAFCFMGGGSELQRVKLWAENGRLKNIFFLPYQPLKEMAGPLSAADAHVVVMGNAMLGLVHPCKIYNILAVGAPVVYIGPQPSHVTEILELPEAGHAWCSVRHGEGEILAERIRQLRPGLANRGRSTQLMARFAKDVLLPRMIAGLENSAAKQPCSSPAESLKKGESTSRSQK